MSDVSGKNEYAYKKVHLEMTSNGVLSDIRGSVVDYICIY
jgi:hypothetical protein